MKAEAKYMIEDLKNQIGRLSEERALYFAIARDHETECNQLQGNIEILTQQLESSKEKEKILKEEIEELKKQKTTEA
jgi:predicted RNase H-like nuclease (RuvC/YqgF family)